MEPTQSTPNLITPDETPATLNSVVADTESVPSQDEAAVEGDDSYAESEEGIESEPAFQWQASEFVQHHKGLGWYALFGVVFVILIVVAVVTQQWLSIAVLMVMAAAVAVYAHKPPRVLLYQLDESGVTIEARHYPYEQFRSFAVLQDEAWHAIDLEPTQRFMPRLTVIFDSEDLQGIVDHLSIHLPRADRQPDLVERLTRYLRF